MAKEVRALLYNEGEIDTMMKALLAAGLREDQVRVEKPSPVQARQQVKSKRRSSARSAIYGVIAGVVAGLLIGLLGGQGAMRNLLHPVNADFGQLVWLVIVCALFFGGFGALFSFGMNKLSTSPANESSGAERPVMVINPGNDAQEARVHEIITQHHGAAPLGPGERNS